MDKNTSELLLVQPVDANEDAFSLRTALVRKYVLIALRHSELTLTLHQTPVSVVVDEIAGCPYLRDETVFFGSLSFSKVKRPG